MLMLLLASIAWATMLVVALTLAAGLKKMRRLDEVTRGAIRTGELVSIIVPACNEEHHIEASLRSLLAQDYEALEIIVVDDRSTDGTGAIIDRLAARYPTLITTHIDQVPDGWVGKSHALAIGAQQAKGQYLVFTDADVVLDSSTIARAVEYMTGEQLDHLTLLFKNTSRGWLLNSLILEAAMGLLFLFRPWRAKSKNSRCFVGVGAFNMVKASAYREIGGHQEFRMHPVDDMMLGRRLKEHGFAQDCLLGYRLVALPWYGSVGAMIGGLEKNMFALVHYRLSLIPVLLLGITLVTILPLWGVILATGLVRLLCFGAVALRLLVFWMGARLQDLPASHLAGALVTPYIYCYIFVRSAYVTVKNGGISWRGKHYPLAELKKTTPFIR